MIRKILIIISLFSLFACNVQQTIEPKSREKVLLIGNNGIINVAGKSEDSVLLSWTKATYGVSSNGELEYLVYFNKEQVDLSVSSVESKATQYSQYTANIDSIKVKGLESDTLYYFYLVVKNIKSEKVLYQQVSATTDKGTSSPTPETELEPYYSSATGLTGDALKAELNKIISGHTVLSYRDTREALLETDEDPNNPNNFILIYTGESLSKTVSRDLWNREHVWAKSHGDFGNDNGPGTDLHHLRAANPSANSSRGNKDFDEGGQEYKTSGNYSDSDSWEPRDEVKGDIARMIFYMATRYEGNDSYVDLEVTKGVETSPNKEPLHGNLSVLKEWNNSDPVSDMERARNDEIYNNWQHNRNPFIDHPEWVEAIW